MAPDENIRLNEGKKRNVGSYSQPPSIPSFILNYSNISHVENNRVFAYNEVPFELIRQIEEAKRQTAEILAEQKERISDKETEAKEGREEKEAEREKEAKLTALGLDVLPTAIFKFHN
ncbi:MAG: hypothetical protein N2312_01740 [Dictyoglomaceae bacterium]|nr:hypothetical protein [Dictyoglomaceae bacterium]